ncbi:hypothetical protein [Desulfonema magnum]|uniref:Uncharacterized protein n=1 Tax=Desulfonema magnum TaxID=45655 RepID=A0A975BNX2_9BACT|nr:hypothetical protein [Desulfonema magnum]QTA88941.1 Uncharacterized protein dnm_049880 [Desulfonema magnum]
MAHEASGRTDLFSRLIHDTDISIAALDSKTKVVTNEQLDTFKQKFEEAEQIKDEKQRDARMKVLEADFSKLRKAVREEETDLANAVLGLNAIIESLGGEYNELQTMSPEEEELVRKAEEKLGDAKRKLEKAKGKWKFLGRDRSVAKAKAEIKAVEQEVAEAAAEARRLARERLMKHNMEQSLQEFMYKVEKTIVIIEHRVEDIKAQLASVSARKEEAFRIKEEAAKALEKLDNDLNGLESELSREEELLETFVNGTPEHTQQSQKVSDMRAQVEDIRGRRNNAFVLFQSKEKFAAELEIHERTQMKLRDNHRMWITSLRSDTEERVVTFKSRLEAMKAMADQDVAKQLDNIGAEIDQSNVEYMAASGYASDRVRMEKIEKHPDRIAKIAKVQAAQAEAIQKIRMRENKAIEAFKDMYGIDPTESSFFHYEE